MLIDSHAHLNFPDLEGKVDYPGVSKIVVVGTSLEDSKKALELALKHKHVFATVGIHPNDDSQATAGNVDWTQFENLANKGVAIGECGLDFSREQDKERQFALFDKQIEIAEKLDLPLVIHIRDAQEDLISVFGHKLSKSRGVFHCFSGNENYLHTVLKLLPEFYVSYAGNITFKSANGLRELVKLTPIEKMLVETDSPFLSPEPHRGERNTPVNVKIVAERVALLKEIPLDAVSEITTKNAERLFNI